MQSNIADRAESLEQEMSDFAEDCQKTAHSYGAMISELESQYREAQTGLAEATQDQNEADEEGRVKHQQLVTSENEYHAGMDKCRVNLRSYEKEICGVRKVRAELLRMNNQDVFVQDCSVSSWIPQECSVSCGGGAQRLTRTIVSQPTANGAQCPPLSMQQACNEQLCPIDCDVTEFSEWSSCSAACGGGVMQRARTVTVWPQHGGESCGETSQTQGCNIQACDVDCQLGDWTAWSGCSKMCDGGFMERTRDVEVAVVGLGRCPADISPSRVEYLPCNEQTCQVALAKTAWQCDSKLDVVLILDGSASLEEAGWTKMKEAAAQLASALTGGENGVKLGALLMGGPTDWDTFQRCSHGGADITSDCGMEWMSHLSLDNAAVSASILSATWPESTALTATALMSADNELINGRPDAEAVVVVMTDANFMSPRATSQAAKQLREKARLMWIAVTAEGAMEDITDWVSPPIHANAIQVNDFDILSLPETINTLIADICPEVA